MDSEEKGINLYLSVLSLVCLLCLLESRCILEGITCVYLYLTAVGSSCRKWPVSIEKHFLQAKPITSLGFSFSPC